MSLSIYDTMRREKATFEPINEEEVRMYVCGPTVYDKAHVGHAMSSLVFDVIRRYLEYKGYRVRHVMNYTDVDDKVIQRAQVLEVDPLKLAEGLIEEYDRHLMDLNILPAHVFPRVSEEIDTIIHMVKGLIEKGYAYEVEGDVFFRVARDEDYGRLSGRRLEEMRAGARTEIDSRKEDPADFALWKSAKPGEPSWESPWGPGRPGWHIECSSMSYSHLGEQIDIHGGGNDLIFPHHENEIAQTESYTGKPFASFWIHNGMMQLGEEKMSKSLGNLVTVEEFLEEHEGDILRMMVLNSGYRKPLTFTDEVVQQAGRALGRLRGALRPASPEANTSTEVQRELQDQMTHSRRGFEAAMSDDFNTAGALSHLFDLVRVINQSRDLGVAEGPLEQAQGLLIQLTGVLGLDLEKHLASGGDIAPYIELLIEIREDLREARQWKLADRIRDRLAGLGITLEDRKDGTIWLQDGSN